MNFSVSLAHNHRRLFPNRFSPILCSIESPFALFPVIFVQFHKFLVIVRVQRNTKNMYSLAQFYNRVLTVAMEQLCVRTKGKLLVPSSPKFAASSSTKINKIFSHDLNAKPISFRIRALKTTALLAEFDSLKKASTAREYSFPSAALSSCNNAFWILCFECSRSHFFLNLSG